MFLSTCHNPVLEDGPLGGRCLPCCGRRPNRADLYDPVHLCFTSSIPCLLLSVMDWRTTYPRDFCLTRSPTKGNEEASIHKANTSCICSVYRDLCEGILIQISSSKGELWRRENTDPVQPHPIHCAHRAPHMGMGLMVVWGLFSVVSDLKAVHIVYKSLCWLVAFGWTGFWELISSSGEQFRQYIFSFP